MIDNYHSQRKPRLWGPRSSVISRVADAHKAEGFPQPVLRLPFWEGAGGRVYDLGGNGNDGTWNGTGNHWSGGAAQFNGSDDYVDFGYIDVLNLESGQLTIISRIYNDLTHTASIAGVRHTVFSGWFFRINGADAGDDLQFTIFGESDTKSIPSGLVANTWQGVAVTYNMAASIFYVNGVFLSTHAENGTIVGGARGVYIGAFNSTGAPASLFNGLMDEVTIYNEALTPSQVKFKYENPDFDIQPPSTTYYLFGEAAPAGATAALTGTLSDNATEAQIQAGGETLIITLTDDTWVADVGADNAITDALIAGLDSDGEGLAGWDAEVKANADALDYDNIVRDENDVKVTITLESSVAYDILENETITVTIPATAVTSATEIVADTTFQVTPIGVGARPQGPFGHVFTGPFSGPI